MLICKELMEVIRVGLFGGQCRDQMGGRGLVAFALTGAMLQAPYIVEQTLRNSKKNLKQIVLAKIVKFLIVIT